MKAKCYYCNKELTERTIKRHMKSCLDMKKVIEEKLNEKKGTRNQYIISLKALYESNYCIYVSIDANLQLKHLDQFIRDIWVECCGHLSAFIIEEEYYNSDDGEMDMSIDDILMEGEKFGYDYDFGSTTELILEVVDIIEVSKTFSQIEIIARNHDVKNKCEKCGKEAHFFDHSGEEYLCKNCVDEDNDEVEEFEYSNSPRDGVCGYYGDKDSEIKYMPGNKIKYKCSKKRSNRKEEFGSDVDNFDDGILEEVIGDLLEHSGLDETEILDELFKIYNESEELEGPTLFDKGIFSFDLKELISAYNKKDLQQLAKNLEIEKISKLNKKDLTDKIVNEYKAIINKKLLLFDEDRYLMLKKYLKNGLMYKEKFDEVDILKNAALMSDGIIYPAFKAGKEVLIMPTAMQNILKEKETLEYRNIIKHNTEILKYVRAGIKIYGVLSFSQVNELLSTYEINEMDINTLENLTQQASLYYDEFSIDLTRKCVVNDQMDEDIIDNILNYIEPRVRVNKEELLIAVQENWISKTSYGKRFIKQNNELFEIQKDALYNVMEELYYNIQVMDVEELLEELTEQFENDEELKVQMYNIFKKFLGNIRLWKYRGATINEINGEEEEPKKISIGRNDPCICGSGKKYKKCCGKNDNVIKLFSL